MTEMITPPVAASPVAPELPPRVAEDLTVVQSLIRADKAGFVATILHGAIMLEMYLGLHLTAAQIAVMGTMISVLVTYFLGLHFSTKAKK